jgi:ubiquinone/menaquinone biosynthesis C-methylase UbiE
MNTNDIQERLNLKSALEILESQILNDLLCLKIINILFEKSIIEKWASNKTENNLVEQDLPPPILAVLRRAGLITEMNIVNPMFLLLIRKRGVFFEQKVKFMLIAIQDFLQSADLLLWNPEAFMQVSRVFSCFDYSKGFDLSPQARVDTQSWCHYVSALTLAEAGSIVEKILESFGVDRPQRVLELGGNIGVFAAEFARSVNFLDYRIIDIPQVCNLGQAYINENSPESIIRFVSGDMFIEEWNEENCLPPDLIIFKSVLHDWPIHRAETLTRKSCNFLPVGGRLCIVERCKFSAENLVSKNLFDVANIIFSPFYRNPDVYVSMIESVVGHNFKINIHYLDLDMRWFCLIAEKLR